MSPDLHASVMRELQTFEFKPEGTWLRKGLCPNCGKRELYVNAEHPWVLRCGRLNNCGWEGHIKEVLPQLFRDWSERARETVRQQGSKAPPNPHLAADLYLAEMRGFDLNRIAGWYTQETYHDPQADHGRGAASATVRFAVGDAWWERLIDRPERFGKKKARFKPGSSYQGLAWLPPGLLPAEEDELWLVEGIFDSISLLHHQFAAAATLSCNNYPDRFLSDLKTSLGARKKKLKLVWAYDSDAAGQRFTLKHVERARAEGWTCEAAQIPRKGRAKRQDWNDLHQLDRLNLSNIEEYRYHGALLIAESPKEKGLTIYRRFGGQRTEFDFDFGRELYWFSIDLRAFNEAMSAPAAEGAKKLSDEARREEALRQAHRVTPIATCLPEPLYYQQDKVIDEAWYYYRISFPGDKPPVKATFTAGQLAAAGDFKKRLLHVAPGAFWSGKPYMLDRIIQRTTKWLPEVQTVDYVGYVAEHDAYVYQEFAVKDGRVARLNDEDYFELGRLGINSRLRTASVAIQVDPEQGAYKSEWIAPFWDAFGARGLVVLAHWLGALFAQQIRRAQASFPFLELVGRPGAGKSSLLVFLWKLLGRADYEGIDPNKGSPAGRARTMSQVSNLPIVLIESERGEEEASAKPHWKQFDWDEVKTFYNGGTLRVRGVANGGNDTYEPPFRGALVISQNAAVSASDAVLERIVHVGMDKSHHGERGREGAERLRQMPVLMLSGFLVRALQRADEMVSIVTGRTRQHELGLAEDTNVGNARLVFNHAQVAALVDALGELDPTLGRERCDQAHALLRDLLTERAEALATDSPVVEKFWQAYTDLEGLGVGVNHAHDEKRFIAVNLNQFMSEARSRDYAVPHVDDLQRALRSSRRHKFLRCDSVHSVIRAANSKANPKAWCWVFERNPATTNQ